MKKSRILFVALLVLATLSFTSCLNDLEDHYGGFASSPALAELAEAPSAATGMISREIKDPTQPLTVNFKVNIATPKRLSSATTVTLAFDNTILDLYNAERGLTGDNALIPIPLDALTFSGYTVTIPGGELMTDWIITIDPTQVNDLVAKAYALPVKIVSADNGVGVSGNYGARIMRVLARNEFDGKYKMRGFVMRPGDETGLEGWFPNADYSLITESSNAVRMNRVQVWGDGVSNIGGIQPWTITVDKSGGGSSYPIILTDTDQGDDFIMDPEYPSRFDVALRTFYWKVNWGTATPKNRGCTDTLVYVGPR